MRSNVNEMNCCFILLLLLTFLLNLLRKMFSFTPNLFSMISRTHHGKIWNQSDRVWVRVRDEWNITDIRSGDKNVVTLIENMNALYHSQPHSLRFYHIIRHWILMRWITSHLKRNLNSYGHIHSVFPVHTCVCVCAYVCYRHWWCWYCWLPLSR